MGFCSLLIEIMNFIVEDKSRIASWIELRVDEIRIFLRLLYHMETFQLSSVQDYWKTHRIFNLTIFREHMRRN